MEEMRVHFRHTGYAVRVYLGLVKLFVSLSHLCNFFFFFNVFTIFHSLVKSCFRTLERNAEII